MTETTINQLLQDGAEVALLQGFGIGPRSYANLEARKKYPWCWIYNIAWQTKVLSGAQQINYYKVQGQIADTVSLDEKPEVIQSKIKALLPYCQRLISYLGDNCIEIKEIYAVQVIHIYDDNLVGIEFSFTIQISESITYAC